MSSPIWQSRCISRIGITWSRGHHKIAANINAHSPLQTLAVSDHLLSALSATSSAASAAASASLRFRHRIARESGIGAPAPDSRRETLRRFAVDSDCGVAIGCTGRRAPRAPAVRITGANGAEQIQAAVRERPNASRAAELEQRGRVVARHTPEGVLGDRDGFTGNVRSHRNGRDQAAQV